MEEKMKDKLEERENVGMERLEVLIQKLIIASRSNEIERAVTDKKFQKALFEEFGI